MANKDYYYWVNSNPLGNLRAPIPCMIHVDSPLQRLLSGELISLTQECRVKVLK